MITLTITAEKKLKEKIATENEGQQIPETAGLRLTIGNNGRRIFLGIEKTPKDSDLVVNSKGIRFFIDPENQEHLNKTYPNNALICWVEGQYSSGFIIENPNPR